MQANDPNIRWVEEPQLGLTGRMYLPLFVQGLTTVFGHVKRSVFGDVMTVSYPEEEPQIGNPLIYRGVHRLNKDSQGRVKCVACFLCATACPAWSYPAPSWSGATPLSMLSQAGRMCWAR